MNLHTNLVHRTRFVAAGALLAAGVLFAGCASAGRVEVGSSASSSQSARTEVSSPNWSVEALGSAPSTATPPPTAASPAEAAATATAPASPPADVRSSGSNATAGTGDVVVRARSTVNGTAYEVLCTRTGGGGQPSSVAVRQQTTTESGVVKARVVLSTNGNEYPVVVDGVANASALAALNSSLTNVACSVTT